ncbi:MAG: tetraacyldisaccharide 4'-kinase [Pseudomonadota bacterium]
MKLNLDLYADRTSWRALPAAFFSWGGAIRRFFYRTGLLETKTLPARVISVGALAVGGTGKTPATIMIARLLQARSVRVAILSRGYKGRAAAAVNVVSDGEKILLGPTEAGDEAYLMAATLPGVPVLTGPDRYRTGKFAVERHGAETLILDDGFQHLRLARDLNLLLLDARRPWANGRLLPAGPLREPPRAAGRADAFLLTGATGAENPFRPELERLFPGRPIFPARHRPRRFVDLAGGGPLPLDILAGRRVLVFCGLARPQGFIDAIISLGAQVDYVVKWPDHFHPRAGDIEKIKIQAQRLGIELAATTAKDAVKLEGRSFGSLRTLVLEIEMELWDGRDDFQALLENRATSTPDRRRDNEPG